MMKLWLLLLQFLILVASEEPHDEFHAPTHTPLVQILSPSPARCLQANTAFTVAIAAPTGCDVEVHIRHALPADDSASDQATSMGMNALPPIILPGDQQINLTKVCTCGENGGTPPRGWQESFPSLENPLLPGVALRHHPLLEEFGRWEGNIEAGYLTDWLGVRTRYAWDCIPGGGYFMFVPSRRLQCLEYDGLIDDDVKLGSSGPYVKGFLPPVDDEYPEYIDMLRSVKRSRGKRYTVVELGSSYGVWGVRAVAAYRSMFPLGVYDMVAVESTAHRFRQLRHNMLANGIANSTLVFGAILAPGAMPDATCTSPEATTLTIDDILEGYDHVDYLDLDIQGQELPVLTNSQTLDAINAKVISIHIGTHGPMIHHQLREVFLQQGWIKELDYEWGMDMKCDREMRESLQHLPTSAECMTPTQWGPVYIRDGMLGFFNPNFATDYYQEIP